ncbi:hypothetical protein LQ777_13550 [Spirosoma oryzicola]|nr:hypothetical protein LQ777_13550 [Spirosoma oryzicola]
MRQVNLFIATRLDSYIAGPHGEIDWLYTEGDFGYEAFMKRLFRPISSGLCNSLRSRTEETSSG